ncbi:hypothetical protein LIBAT_11810 [Leptospira interrogans]
MRRIKNAHFSSVPTRMSLFICKKYVFLIEKNFPNLTTSVPHPKIGKTQQNALYESCSKLKLRTKYRIMFLSCNLLTGSESVVWFA